jgi:glycosyltransferase involved in cell wall biosynthesis
MLPPHLDATLAVHGDSDRYPSFADELRELAGDEGRISFRGAFSRDELGRVMSELDVLAVPSRWYENAPGVIFEAFAAGMPIVATNLKGLSEFVKHGENGLLFELENAGDLSRQLRRLCEEPGLLERLLYEGNRSGLSPLLLLTGWAAARRRYLLHRRVLHGHAAHLNTGARSFYPPSSGFTEGRSSPLHRRERRRHQASSFS